MPGDDPLEAARVVAGELPDLPHLAELPGRGPGADMVGRAAAVLAGIHVDLQPSGWRVVARPGIDERRAADHLSRDLDALEQVSGGHPGLLKCQIAGPWTLGAGLELPRGDRVASDRIAVRDVTAALAEGLREQVADLRRRAPAATVVVQLDEPSLLAIRLGRIRTASGFGTLRQVDDTELSDLLQVVIDGAGAPVGVHCCADSPPLDLLRGRGLAFVSIDATALATRQYDDLGELVEEGCQLLLGVVPTTEPSDAPDPGPRATSDIARRLWQSLSYPAETLAARVVLTPACGLAAASPEWAQVALTRVREAGRALAEAPEG